MSDTMRGRDLRVHRMKAGLTQNQLADRLGLHRSIVSAAETESVGEFVSEDFANRYLEACGQTAGAA